MDDDDSTQVLEGELHWLSARLTMPQPHECLLCYMYRMLDFGCNGLAWACRYRDLTAPRATRLEQRLARRGGYCDCEVFLNAYELSADLWDPDAYCEDHQPDPVPECRGVRRGSTQPCGLWRERWRPPYGPGPRW